MSSTLLPKKTYFLLDASILFTTAYFKNLSFLCGVNPASKGERVKFVYMVVCIMGDFIKRVLGTLTAGYILMYYSELVFWAKYDPAHTALPDLFFTFLVYSLVTYGFFSVITMFRVRTLWALFLAGAVYGWLLEGVVVQTMYAHFPLQISFTGLAWHALISVLIGWYWVMSALKKSYSAVVSVSGLIGLFYGFWAICWWGEEGITSLGAFSLYVITTSVVLIGCYWVYHKLQPFSFEPTRIERVALAAFFVCWFVLGTLQVQPSAAVVLPPLFGLVYMALKRNRKVEQREDLIAALQGDINVKNYLFLFLIPFVAVVVYAFFLLSYLWIPTNILVYVITTPLGFILFIFSVVKIFQKSPPGP